VVIDIEDVMISGISNGFPFIRINDLEVYKRGTKQCMNCINEYPIDLKTRVA
jgi:hypothetical protein